MRLHRGCSPRATPGGTYRELLPTTPHRSSRCNTPGATPGRFSQLPLITRLHRGCSPRATPGATDRELLPIVHRPMGLLCKYTCHPGLEGGTTPAGVPSRHAPAEVCQQRSTEVHHLRWTTTTDPTENHDLSWTPATASRLLTESYSRCNKPGAIPESYSRCNKPGATPES